MRELDCLGDFCPIPIMKLQRLSEEIKNGESVKLIIDHSCVFESILSYCKKSNFSVKVVEPMNGIWELNIAKKKPKKKLSK